MKATKSHPSRPRTPAGELRRVARMRRGQVLRDEGLAALRAVLDDVAAGQRPAITARGLFLLEKLRLFLTAVLREHRRRSVAAKEGWL